MNTRQVHINLNPDLITINNPELEKTLRVIVNSSLLHLIIVLLAKTQIGATAAIRSKVIPKNQESTTENTKMIKTVQDQNQINTRVRQRVRTTMININRAVGIISTGMIVQNVPEKEDVRVLIATIRDHVEDALALVTILRIGIVGIIGRTNVMTGLGEIGLTTGIVGLGEIMISTTDGIVTGDALGVAAGIDAEGYIYNRL